MSLSFSSLPIFFPLVLVPKINPGDSYDNSWTSGIKVNEFTLLGMPYLEKRIS
jgi:hypothetical protein